MVIKWGLGVWALGAACWSPGGHGAWGAKQIGRSGAGRTASPRTCLLARIPDLGLRTFTPNNYPFDFPQKSCRGIIHPLKPWCFVFVPRVRIVCATVPATSSSSFRNGETCFKILFLLFYYLCSRALQYNLPVGPVGIHHSSTSCMLLCSVALAWSSS